MAMRGYEIALRTLGPEHRTTFLIQGDLARVSQQRGETQNAIARFEEVLLLQKEFLGDSHPHTIQTLLSLAELKQDEVMAREASSKAEGALGEQDALSIQGLLSLARIVAEKGRVTDARLIHERLLSLAAETYEGGHEITIRCKDRLAFFESRYGDANKADRLYQEILGDSRSRFGESDERSLDAFFEYVRYLREAGRYAEAVDFGVELSGLREVLPERSGIKLIRVYRELAEAQKLRSNLSGALENLVKALKLAESALGPGHEKSIELVYDQSLLWKEWEHPSKQIEVLEKALPVAKVSLAEGHELTKRIEKDLEGAKRLLNLYVDAAKEGREAYLKVRSKSWLEKPEVFQERNRLIEILARVPAAEKESRKLIDENIRKSRLMFGKEDPVYFRALQVRARNAELRHQFQLADQFYQELVDAQRKAGMSRSQRMFTTLFTWSESLAKRDLLSKSDAIIDAWQDEVHDMEWPEERVQILIPRRSQWNYRRYLKGQNNDWRTDLSSDLPGNWKCGRAPIGYGVSGIGTMPLTDGDGRVYYTTCFHREFEVEDPTKFQSLKIRLRRENGAAVFINGEKVRSHNLYQTTVPGTSAKAMIFEIERNAYYAFRVSPSCLKKGVNIISTQLHQAERWGAHMVFDLELQGLAKPE